VNYLLINHIAAHPGGDAARLRLPAAWARDVGAAARAANAAGVRLIVATPLSEAPAPTDAVDLLPDEVGFEHFALPGYASARTFLRERDVLSTHLRSAIAAADVVQLDLGGHPVPLGLFADPIVKAVGKRKLWIVGRSLDLRPGSRSRHAAKRVVARTLGAGMRRSLVAALRSADRIIASTQAVVDEVEARAGMTATLVESIGATDVDLPTAATISARHARLIESDRPLRIAAHGPQTVDRGLDHVLAAMHRCWRLSAPVTLVASNAGGEIEALRRHVEELGLSSAVTFLPDPEFADVDVVVDTALANHARLDLDAIVARGTPVIAYAPRNASPGVKTIERGAVDALAEALFRAATDRGSLATLLIAGHAWARDRTLDAAHRRRFELARQIAPAAGARGAA
jgi:hypothetical protein